MSNNALHDAAKAGNVVEVQAQIDKFDINAKDDYGKTALYWAASGGKTEVVKLLLTHNPAPDVNLPNVSTPTMMFVHLTRISPLPYIYTTPPLFYPSRHVLLSRVVDVPPPTTQHDIQYYLVLFTTSSEQYYLHYGSPVFLYYLDTLPPIHYSPLFPTYP